MPKDKKSKKSKKDKKEKKPKSSKKDKKSKSDPSTTSSPPSAPSSSTTNNTSNAAFLSGQMFERHNRGGVLQREDFQRLIETEQLRPPINAQSRNPEDDFEVGRLFERFSRSQPGNLNQEEFGNLLRTMSSGAGASGNSIRNAPSQQHHANSPTSYASTMATANSATGSIANSNPSTLPRALSELRNNRQHQRPHNGRGLPLASTELHILSMNMMSKRDQLVQQMRHVQGRTEEVQSVRRAIERETIADTEAILHRLRSVEAFKVSLLNHDMTQLQHDIDEIDAFTDEMQGVDNGTTATTTNNTNINSNTNSNTNTNTSNPSSFMNSQITGATTARGRYLETCAEAERIINKPFKATTEVHADDYDREVADRLGMAREFNGMQDALEEKDRMLLKLLDEQKVDKNRQTELTQKIEDFSRRSRAEMEEWVKLCKHLKQQLAEARIEGSGGGLDLQ